MNYKNLFYPALIIFLIIQSCSIRPDQQEEPRSGIEIAISADSSEIQINKIPHLLVETLRADSMDQKQWQSLFAVYPQASDPELTDLQSPLKGNYRISGSTVYFKPDTAFKKQQTYMVQYFPEKFITTETEIIRSKKLPYKNKPYSVFITF